MTIVPLGKISVPTPGTPVAVISPSQVTALIGSRTCASIIFRPCVTKAGVTYVGVAGMNHSTYSGVAYDFNKPATTGIGDSFALAGDVSNDQVDPCVWYVDAANAGDGVLVSLTLA